MPPCTIDSRHSSFRSGAKDAAKRHRSFAFELKKILEKIEADCTGCGDQIRCKDPLVHTRKVRIGCPDENLAPRHGYRLIYQVLRVEEVLYARLLDLFYKPMQASINDVAVKRLIELAPGLPVAAERSE